MIAPWIVSIGTVPSFDGGGGGLGFTTARGGNTDGMMSGAMEQPQPPQYLSAFMLTKPHLQAGSSLRPQAPQNERHGSLMRLHVHVIGLATGTSPDWVGRARAA